MKYILPCGGDLRALGIENDQGVWDLRTLYDHLTQCQKCSHRLRQLKEYLWQITADHFPPPWPTQHQANPDLYPHDQLTRSLTTAFYRALKMFAETLQEEDGVTIELDDLTN